MGATNNENIAAYYFSQQMLPGLSFEALEKTSL